MTIAPTINNRYMSKSNHQSKQKAFKVCYQKILQSYRREDQEALWYTNTMSGINWATVPVTIIEMGFMSNPGEDRKMQKKAYQKKMVKGIADGIDAFLK